MDNLSLKQNSLSPPVAWMNINAFRRIIIIVKKQVAG
jgi:hypothetical protein